MKFYASSFFPLRRQRNLVKNVIDLYGSPMMDTTERKLLSFRDTVEWCNIKNY